MPGTKAPLGVAPYRRVERTAAAAVTADIRTGGTFGENCILVLFHASSAISA